MGADMPAVLRERRDPGFVPMGHVEDLATAFSTIRVMVAPLRVGAGAKGKVASALAHGVPSVISPIAAEGMGLIDRKHVLVSDNANSFVQNVVDVYNSEELWRTLSEEGLELMRERYSPEKNYDRIKDMLKAVGARLPS